MFLFQKSEAREPTGTQPTSSPEPASPPQWTPAPEVSYDSGLYNEASQQEYELAEKFCQAHPLEQPRLQPSHVVDRINAEGCRAWGLELPLYKQFQGQISEAEKGAPGVWQVVTGPKCKSTCILSDLPILAGMYEIQGKAGVYYEILIQRMDGIVVIGSACRPYPPWRMPGWNRESAGLHLDDMRKFFEDPDGGRDYDSRLTNVRPGDTIGFGYAFSTASVFFTWNGARLNDAFTGVYLPRHAHDVYAAIGVEGANSFQVNFGGGLFKWLEGNEWAWRVEGHVGRLSSSSRGRDQDLPAYSLDSA